MAPEALFNPWLMGKEEPGCAEMVFNAIQVQSTIYNRNPQLMSDHNSITLCWLVEELPCSQGSQLDYSMNWTPYSKLRYWRTMKDSLQTLRLSSKSWYYVKISISGPCKKEVQCVHRSIILSQCNEGLRTILDHQEGLGWNGTRESNG